MPLAKWDVTRLLTELASALPTYKDRNLETLAGEYFRALNDCSLEELEAAKKEAVRTLDKFPSAAKLRAFALEHRKDGPGRAQSQLTLREEYHRWERAGMNGPCPVCSSVLEWRDGQRGHVYHDHQRHVEARIGYSGPTTGPVEYSGKGGAQMRPVGWTPPIEAQPELASEGSP